MTNAEVLAAELARSGVERVFGVPGGEVVLLLEACRRAGIRFILTGHEAAAAFMADVTGRLRGLPGVCLATLGPGAVNLGLGVANALLDRSPVVVLTAQLPASLAAHFPHQRLPLDRFFGSLCKASVALEGAGTVEIIQGALGLAADPPPGPVHVAVPSDVAGEQATPGWASAERRWQRTRPRSSEGLSEVAALLAQARRPLLVVGVGCTLSDVPALRLFVDRAQMPFVVTPKATGTLPEDAPGFLGVVGGMALDRAVMENVDEADFLLGVAFDPVECDKDWYLRRTVANLTRWPTGEGGYRPVEALGDLGELLDALAPSVNPAPWPPELLARCRARIRPFRVRGARASAPWRLWRACETWSPRRRS